MPTNGAIKIGGLKLSSSGASCGPSNRRPVSNVPMPPRQAPTIQASWRNGGTDKAFEEIRRALGEQFNTGHHKLPKSMIQQIYNLMTPSQRQLARQLLDLAPSSEATALKNLGSNITVGPLSGAREDDPSRGFDPNRTRGGGLTPRSQMYEQLFDFMTKRGNSDSATQPFSDEEFEFVLSRLEAAEKIHYTKTGGELLDSDISMWSQDTGKWTRVAIGGYEPTILDVSVRSLKNEKHRAAAERRRSYVDILRPQLWTTSLSPHWEAAYTRSSALDALESWGEGGYTRYYSAKGNDWWYIRNDQLEKTLAENKDKGLRYAHVPEDVFREQLKKEAAKREEREGITREANKTLRLQAEASHRDIARNEASRWHREQQAVQVGFGMGHGTKPLRDHSSSYIS